MKFPIVSSLFLLATASSASPLNCDDGVEAKVDVKYFDAEGWEFLPSGGLSSLDPYATGTTTSIDYRSASGEFGGRPHSVAALFQGYLNVDLGITKICIDSDDGSKLFLDDMLWIDNDGLHGAVTKCADVSPGVHKFDLEYFQGGGAAYAILQWGTSKAVTVVPPTAWTFMDHASAVQTLVQKGWSMERINNAPSKRFAHGNASELSVACGVYSSTVDFAVAKALIALGLDVNYKANGGIEPLFGAASYNDREICDLLLNNGADLAHQIGDGRTAMDEARRRGHNELAEYLDQILDPNTSDGAWTCAPKEKVRFEKFGWYQADDLSEEANFDKEKCFFGGKPVKVKFPIDEDSAYCLRYHSNSVSVKSSASNGECSSQLDFNDLIDGLRALNVYPPLQPEDKAFLTEFAEVVRAQKLLKFRKENPCMTDPLPQVMKAMTHLWKGFSILDVAEAVHDEFPGIYHNQMIANWLATPGNAVFNNDVIPKTGNKDFIRGPVMLSQMIGFAIRAVGPCDFTLKWGVGRARPEEIAWKVYQGEFAYEEQAFDEVKNSILDMNLKSATDFTEYAEGSPTHPSWPAMRSAASAASFWLDIVMDLTEEQLCEARMLDYSVSYARTVAGVHYPSDNIAGLIAGEEILARKLPDLLHEEYGSDKDYVKDLIRKKKEEREFGWNTFEDSPCYKNSKYKTVTAAKPPSCYDQRDLPLLDVTAPQPPGSYHSEL